MTRNNLFLNFLIFCFYFLAACGKINTNQISDGYAVNEENQIPVLHLYTDLPVENFKSIADDFLDVHHIKLEVESSGAEQVIRKIELEKGNPNADLVILSNADRLNRLAEAKLIQPITAQNAISAVPKYFSHPDNLWFGISYSPRVIIYSRERVDPRKIKYYTDLSKPLWQGRLLMGSSEDINNQELLGSMLLELDEEKVLAWAKGVSNNTLYGFMDDDQSRIENISRGKGDVAVVVARSIASMQEIGSTVEKNILEAIAVLEPVVDERGASVKITGIAKVAESKNTKQAETFISYLFTSEESEEFAAALFEIPVLKDAGIPEKMEEWAAIEIDTASQYQIANKKQEIVAIMDKVGWK